MFFEQESQKSRSSETIFSLAIYFLTQKSDGFVSRWNFYRSTSVWSYCKYEWSFKCRRFSDGRKRRRWFQECDFFTVKIIAREKFISRPQKIENQQLLGKSDKFFAGSNSVWSYSKRLRRKWDRQNNGKRRIFSSALHFWSFWIRRIWKCLSFLWHFRLLSRLYKSRFNHIFFRFLTGSRAVWFKIEENGELESRKRIKFFLSGQLWSKKSQNRNALQRKKNQCKKTANWKAYKKIPSSPERKIAVLKMVSISGGLLCLGLLICASGIGRNI